MQVVTKDGKTVELPPAQAQAAFLAGEAGVLGDMVPVRDAGGRWAQIPATQVHDALSRGAQLVEPAVYAARKQRRAEEREYGGALQTGITAVEGAVRGATMGLSDVAARGLGFDEYMREAEARARVNPIAEGGGQALGMLGVGLASGGTGLAGSAARATPMAFGSRIAAGASTRALGGAAMASAPRLARVGQAAMTGALEGALYSGGMAASEAARTNTELTTSHVLEAMATGGVAGGVLGGLLGAGGEAFRALPLPSKQKIANELARTSIGGTPGGTPLDWRNYQASVKRRPEFADDVTRIVTEELPRVAGKPDYAMTRELQRTTSETYRKQAGKNIGDFLGELETVAPDFKPNTEWIIRRMRKEVLNDLEQNSGAIPVRNYVKNMIDDMERPHVSADDVKKMLAALEEYSAANAGKASVINRIKPGVKKMYENFETKWYGRDYIPAEELDFTFPRKAMQYVNEKVPNVAIGAKPNSWKQLHTMRNSIDEKVNWTEPNAKDKDFVNKRLRHILEDETEKSIATVSPDKFDQYKTLKHEFEAAQWVHRAATRKQTMDIFSFKNLGAAAVGGLVGGSVGAPVALGARMAFELRGRAALAAVANRIAKSDRDLLGAISSIAKPLVKAPARAWAAHDVNGRYDATQRMVQAAQNNPGFIQQRVDEKLPDADPRLRASVAAMAQRYADEARRVMPQPTANNTLIGGTTRQPSLVQKSNALEVMALLDQPTRIYQEFREGRLTRAKVESMDRVHPEIMTRFRAGLLDEIAKRGDKVAYSRRPQISMLLNAPADATLDKTFVATVQAAHKTPMKGKPSGGGSTKSVRTLATSTQRAAMEE